MLNYLSILRHKIAVKHSQIFYWIIENDKKKIVAGFISRFPQIITGNDGLSPTNSK